MLHKLLQLAGKASGRGKLSILIYHQVLAKPDPMRPSEPTTAVFDWQMKLLRDYFTPLSLADALKHLQQGTLPDNAVCVTFDDGYLNNLTVAQPVLQKYQIPATVYVATAFSNGTNMWNDRLIYLFGQPQKDHLLLDDLRVELKDWSSRREQANQWLKKLKYLPPSERSATIDRFYHQNQATEQPALMMTPAQIRQLAARGIAIGAHTVDHPILKVLPATEQQQQIVSSKLQLEDWLQQPVNHFAYPNGAEGVDFDATAVQLVQDCGFNSAVVTNWGTSGTTTSAFKLRRFTPWDKTPLRFHLRLVRQLLSKGND